MGGCVLRGVFFWRSDSELHRCVLSRERVKAGTESAADLTSGSGFLPLNSLLTMAGLQKWRQNLQLLVPFLEDPQIELFSLEIMHSKDQQATVMLQVCALSVWSFIIHAQQQWSVLRLNGS